MQKLGSVSSIFIPKYFRCTICKSKITCLKHKNNIESTHTQDDYPRIANTYWGVDQYYKLFKLDYTLITHVCSEQCYKYNEILNTMLNEYIPEEKCFICGQQTSLKCSNCKLFYYCSVECQKQDYSNHKNYCFIISC